MEPINDPPSPAYGGQGSHRGHSTEHNHSDKKFCKQTSGKRPASSMFLPDACWLPLKHVKSSWWSKDTVAVVTGANKGLGLEIVRQLAKEGLTVVLTARDLARGQTALNTLKDEGLESIVFHQLDVTSSPSVETLADWLRKEFGGLEILVNNAGVHYHTETYEDAVETIETNYYGVKRVINALLPLMRKSWTGARIINVSSKAASLQNFNSCLKDKVNNVDCLSEGMVDDLATKFLDDVKAGKFTDVKEGSWAMNNYQYCESKLLLNTYTKILARSLSFKQPQSHKIFVNAICPGCQVQTDVDAMVVRKATKAGEDMIRDAFQGRTIQSREDGADTAVRLALLPRATLGSCYPNGRFFCGDKEISF